MATKASSLVAGFYFSAAGLIYNACSLCDHMDI